MKGCKSNIYILSRKKKKRTACTQYEQAFLLFYKYLVAVKGKLEKIICPSAIMSECILIKDLHRSASQFY